MGVDKHPSHTEVVKSHEFSVASCHTLPVFGPF